ncbi:hypothetical protein Vafri_19508, partial [Volvox africanus]
QRPSVRPGGSESMTSRTSHLPRSSTSPSVVRSDRGFTRQRVTSVPLLVWVGIGTGAVEAGPRAQEGEGGGTWQDEVHHTGQNDRGGRKVRSAQFYNVAESTRVVRLSSQYPPFFPASLLPCLPSSLPASLLPSLPACLPSSLLPTHVKR